MTRKLTREEAGRAGWGERVAQLLPGDVIHDVAPISRKKAPLEVSVAAMDAAEAKRRRKREKRKS